MTIDKLNENTESFGIATLTSGDDRVLLQRTIETFLENCSYRPILWGVFDNGSTDDTWDYLQNGLPKVENVIFKIEHSDEDCGCGMGCNRVNDLVRSCKYVLFLENDWTHLSEKECGVSHNWLGDCIQYLEQGNTDYIMLRRFRNEIECRMHSWGHVMKLSGECKTDFIDLNNYQYSNNPHLRYNDAMYKRGILPLKEFIDDKGKPCEHKGHPTWGKAEIMAPQVSGAQVYRWGMFAHESRISPKDVHIVGCGKYGPYGASTCKYGFIKFRDFDKNRGQFCDVCDSSRDWRDLAAHDSRFINIYEHPENIDKMRKEITPCVCKGFNPNWD